MRGYEVVRQQEEEAVFEGEEKAQGRKPKLAVLLPWLPATLTCACSVLLMILFGTPSTLFVYLPFLFVYSAAGLTCLFVRLYHKQRRLVFTPTMATALALVLLPLLADRLSPSHGTQPAFPTARAPHSPSSRLQSPLRRSDGVLFVAANLYNSESILPRFTASLFDLVETVGRDKVFISIYESNSHDSTKTLLSAFDVELSNRNILHHIEMNDSNNHIGVQGDNDRIRFLANIRNKVYDVLDNSEAGAGIKSRIERVLWLNDVVFDSSAAIELLNTNDADFDVACGLDFIPLGLYDTWVMRDLEFKRPKPLWPHFVQSRDIDLLRKGLPIPVSSCWNGIAAFQADWLLSGRPQPFTTPEPKSNATSLDQPTSTAVWPLRFRASNVCLSSECLLINYDIHRLLARDRMPAIFVNPQVRVAYDLSTFYLYNHIPTWPLVKPWQLVWQDFISNRLFWFITDWGRKTDGCAEAFDAGFHAYKETD